jgi:hypothetical protein
LRAKTVFCIFAIFLLIETLTFQAYPQGVTTAQNSQPQTKKIPIGATLISQTSYDWKSTKSTYDEARASSWDSSIGFRNFGSTDSIGGGVYEWEGYLGTWATVDHGFIYPNSWEVAAGAYELTLDYSNSEITKLTQNKPDQYSLQIKLDYWRTDPFDRMPFYTYGISKYNIKPITVMADLQGFSTLTQQNYIYTTGEYDEGQIELTFDLPTQMPSGIGTTIRLLTADYKNGVNPAPAILPPNWPDQHIEAFDQAIYIHVQGFLVPNEDLELKSAEPVQVVFGASAMVKDKPTVIKTQIKSTFQIDVVADFKVTIDNQEFYASGLEPIPKSSTSDSYICPSNPFIFNNVGTSTFSIEIIEVHPSTDLTVSLSESTYTNNRLS